MTSPKRLARIAGLLYLVVAVFGAFAYGFVAANVYVPGDAEATAGNVVEHSGFVRLAVVADLVQATAFVFLALTLFLVLRHVNRDAARAMVVLVAIAATIICLNAVFEFGAMLVATDASYVDAFGVKGQNALVLLLLDLQHYGYLIAQVFFGAWLVPLGYLAFTSGMFPRALGVVLIVAGASYLVDTFAQFLAPELGAVTKTFLVIPPIVGEVWLLGYLLIRGVRTPTDAAGVPAGDRVTAPRER